jgi:hypothetical protein
LLPWSYGASENTAFDAALTLWVSAGQPGFQAANVETWGSMRMPKARLVIAPRGYQANATIVTAEPDATVGEHQVRETVERAVRVLAAALDRGVPTLALTNDVGSALPVAINSIIGVRGPKSEDPFEDEEADVMQQGPSELAQAGHLASPEGPAPDGPTSTGAAPEPPAQSG